MKRNIFATIIFILVIGILFIIQAHADTYSIEFREADIKDVIRCITKMDKKNVIVSDKLEGTVTVSFDGISLDAALRSVLDAHGLIFIYENDVLKIAPLEEFKKLGKDLQADTINLQYAKAPKVIEQVKSLVSERGAAIFDERTNSITVKDTAESLETIRLFLKRLDTRDEQVLIEAKIIEASFDFINSLGIQWGGEIVNGNIRAGGTSEVGTSTFGSTSSNLAVNTPGRGSTGTQGGLGMLTTIGSSTVIAKLSLAEEKGDISILSRPSVTTLNNQAARIRSGVTFYVKANGNISIGSGTSSSSTGQGLQTIESGIELIVTPQITIRDFVKLTIEAQESQPDFSRAVEGIPAIIDNTASTTVLLKNQETTIIGGLLQSRKAEQRKGVPWLSKIPLLGWFFRSKTTSNNKSELLVFIKPTILDGTLTEIPSIKEDKESIYYGKKEK